MHKPFYFLFILFFSWLFASEGALAGAPGLSIKAGKEAEIITLTAPEKGKIKYFQLDNPPRLAVDLPNYQGPRKIGLPGGYAGAVKAVRIAQFNPQVVRVVFELAKPGIPLEAQVSDNEVKLTFRTPSPSAGDTLREAKSPAPEKEKSAKQTPANKQAAEKERPIKEQSVKEKKESQKESKAHTKKERSEESKPMIVIDAGHGGQDPGAQGPDGTYEKEIVLEYARSLKRALLATGRYRVTLTRDGDYFILLRQRTAIARKAGGDLFISLHADSAPGIEARGLSVYTLSETASDAEAGALAASENRSDALSGMDLSHESEDVANILISLAQRETNNTSAMFADLLVRGLTKQEVTLLSHAHRFAGFAVLKAPDMPSVLVETGFISHPEEERLLKSRRYREQLVKGLVDGIDRFFQKRREGIL